MLGTPSLLGAARAAIVTVGSLFEAVARQHAGRVAIEDGEVVRSYRELDARVNQVAQALAGLDPAGVRRFAILSENRAEFLEVQLAAAKLGAVVACQNWRLTAAELKASLDLVEPSVMLVSPRHQGKLAAIAGAAVVMVFGADWERRIGGCSTRRPGVEVAAEAPWLVLYTGGSSGAPKGAAISQRAEIARMMLMECDLGLRPGDDNLAWPAMFHMGGTEGALHALLTGGRVLVEDGFDADRFVARIVRHRFGWVSIMPGTTAAIIEAMERSGVRPAGIGGCGVMPDLVPAAELARVTELLGAPWMNTFGSTETGTPPLSGGRVGIGDRAPDLGKLVSAYTEVRLVDGEGRCVAPGEVGELAMRGPTLFSFYWGNEAATAAAFRDGWFHGGDLFRLREDGRFDFVDRASAMIKSGGENVYPGEIERVLLADRRVTDAVVVRAAHPRWGETPVALVVAAEAAVSAADLEAVCRAGLAGYKRPSRILLVSAERLGRTQQGKVSRKALEAWVAGLPEGFAGRAAEFI